MIDSSVATHSTSEIDQFKALQAVNNSIQLDKSIIRSASFIFGIESTLSIGIVILKMLIELVVFYIIQTNILFLLYLADIDKLGVFFNNINNKLIQSRKSHPIICQYGHAFLPWYISTYSIMAELIGQNLCFLTDIELWWLYCHFSHSFVCQL